MIWIPKYKIKQSFFLKGIFRILVCLSLIAFSVTSIRAQKVNKEFTNKHYTVHDGLAQMQVMSLYQDSKGYLWCYTKAGLSRFDGKYFRNFISDTKLRGFDIVVMGESNNGSLLLFGPEGFNRLVGDSLYSYRYPQNGVSSSIFFHSPKHKLKELLLKSNELETKRVLLDYSRPDSLNIVSVNQNLGNVLFIDSENKREVWQTTGDSIYVSEYESQKLIHRFACPDEIISIVVSGEKKFAISKTNVIYKLDEKTFKLVLPITQSTRFLKVVANPANDALIIATDSDLYYFKKELNLIKKDLTQIREVLFDSEENLWVATEEGLYNFFQLSFENYTFGMGNKDWVWSVLEDEENNYWFASYQNGLWKWDGETVINYTDQLNSKLTEHLRRRPLPIQYRYYMGASKVGSRLFFPTECNVLVYEKGHFKPLPNIRELPYQITKLMPDSSFVCAGYAGLFQIDKKGVVRDWQRDSVKVSSVLNVEMIDGQIIAIGNDGVSFVSTDTVHHFDQEFVKNSYSSIIDHKNNVWISGIKNISLLQNEKLQKVAQVEEEAFYSMLFVAPHYLFLGGIKGLYLTNLQTYYSTGNFEMLRFDQGSGFTGIECGQNGFFTDSKGMVWIPTNDLVSRFDPQKLIHKKIVPPRLFVESQISTDNINWENELLKARGVLDYAKNNVRFNVDIISFANIGSTRIYYQLEGIQEEWSDASEISEITFYDLKPGEYKFRVKADPGISSAMSEISELAFRIKHPIWLTWWFIVLEVLVLFGVIFLVFFYIRKLDRNKALIKQRLTQLRSEALAAQLDPHFVMNCLNNISGLVNAGYKKQANEYIVKFSKLLRVILESVKKESISLSAELVMVEKFMQLEQFRCKHCFEYRLTVPQNYSVEHILVPPMMLQPLVENSIKHGFGSCKIEKPEININVLVEDNEVQFVVTDNGCGLTKNNSLKGTGLGTKITKERIELLQKKNGIELLIEENNPGVKVEFRIPLVMKEN